MKSYHQAVRLALVIGLSLVMNIVLVKPSLATGTITKADLSGTWQITLNGRTGCGLVSMLVRVTLNTAGVGTNATLTTHGECTDSTLLNQTFEVLSLSGFGDGIASLSCGPGCGWSFNIQVSPDRSMFNLVDVNPDNPGNFLGGVAIHR